MNQSSVPGPAAIAGPGVRAEVALQLENASKIFGHITALNNVNLTANPSEILAIVGDNGAGKSTLLKVLAGVYRADSGTVRVLGRPLHAGSPADARKHGISTVFQDLALIETLDVAFNMFLGRQETFLRIFANRRKMMATAEATLRNYQVNVPSVRVPIGELSGGQRQSVAIARAIREDNPIILLDEPTAALGVRETKNIGALISSLRTEGKAVIIVSHDLEFVFEHCDRIQVMRLGRVHAIRRVSKTNREEIVGLITGALPEDQPEDSTQKMEAK